MRVGVDYYPEHWPHDRWETDASLMEKAGLNVVRLAEFAWAFMEPREGEFSFDLLDDALATLDRHGVSAILGTPTGVMPAWVAHTYPETLAMDKAGNRLVYGVRKNNCFSSGAYRLLSERITRAMAGHFAATPNVIGWQTDNEFGGPLCSCGTCRTTFQAWLADRYGTLDELNRAWGTHFWGHRYGSWEEIPMPDEPGADNPSALLDRQRFHTWLTVRFQADQVRILRAECPKHFVTHNFMGMYSEIDYWELAKDLDFVSWDNYPASGAVEFHWDSATAADLMRGLKRKNFWIMEQTIGVTGWGVMGRNPRPGEIRQIAYQQVARGADAMVWFRWRACTAGREQYWHGVLGHDGKPGRRYDEASRTAAELHRLAPVLDGTTVRAEVAMVWDYDSIWAFHYQPAYSGEGGGDGAANFHNAIRRWHRALVRAGVSVDMVRRGSDISSYKVVFAPHLYVMGDETGTWLADFVKAGGVLVADSRIGVKDDSSLCHSRTLPGLLSDALGIEIAEYEALPSEMTYGATGAESLSGKFTVGQFCDWVTPRGAEVLARYGEKHLKDFALVTRNRGAKGWGYYVGGIVKEEGFYDALVSEVLAHAKVDAGARPPAGVESCVREGNGKKVLFLINHTEEERVVPVAAGKEDLLAGGKTGSTVSLPGFGVAVIRLG